ncbi:MAG: helix-turn-helix transcriptional regulator [Gallionellaceae bacterium]
MALPNGHGRVAFLPFIKVSLKSLRKKPFDFEPQTLGEQIKKRRLELDLSQTEAGQMLGVNFYTLLNWEKGRTEPLIDYIPAILVFLGFDPFPKPKTIPERLFAFRRSKGWSIRDATNEFRVAFATWRDWECGKTILNQKHRELVARLLELSVEEFDQLMAV